MEVLDKLTLYKSQADHFINNRLKKFSQDYHKFNNTDFQRTFTILADLAVSGKGIRGFLFLLFVEIYGGKKIKDLLPIAAAIEILHSSLLIHDDIMDEAFLRRGKPSVHIQYQTIARQKNIDNCQSYGKYMAICLGDIGFFIANQIILESKLDAQIKPLLLKFLSEQLVITGLGQMADVEIGMSQNEVDQKIIEKTEEIKTAYYTFYLPINLAYLVTGQTDKNLQELNRKLAIVWGKLFQLTDDLLEFLFEDKQTGKNMGSDIRNNKKTVVRDILFSYLKGEDLKFVKNSFGNVNLSLKDVYKIREIYLNSACQKIMQRKINILQKEAFHLIAKLDIGNSQKNYLKDLTIYLSHRSR